MTYQDVQIKARTVKWRVLECNQPDCWCRLIVPDKPLKYNSRVGDDEIEEEYYIVNSGAISKDDAEHIVTVHNNSLNKQP